MSVHPCGDSHAPPHNTFHAHGDPRDERAPRDDVIAGSSAATVSVRVCAESPPRRFSAPAKEPGASQWPSRRSLHLYQWRPRGRRTTKEDHGLTSPPDRSLDGSTLTDMASTLKQQQRVLDDLTTSVQELRVDVRKTSAGAACCERAFSVASRGRHTSAQCPRLALGRRSALWVPLGAPGTDAEAPSSSLGQSRRF